MRVFILYGLVVLASQCRAESLAECSTHGKALLLKLYSETEKTRVEAANRLYKLGDCVAPLLDPINSPCDDNCVGSAFGSSDSRCKETVAAKLCQYKAQAYYHSVRVLGLSATKAAKDGFSSQSAVVLSGQMYPEDLLTNFEINGQMPFHNLWPQIMASVKAWTLDLIEKRKCQNRLTLPDGSKVFFFSWDSKKGIQRPGVDFFHWFDSEGTKKGFWSCLGGGCGNGTYLIPLPKRESEYFVSFGITSEFGLSATVHRLDSGLTKTCEYFYQPEISRDDTDFKKLASEIVDSVVLKDGKCVIAKPRTGLRVELTK